MADLNQIVGALLRDIAEARSSADFATSEVSSFYRGDEIMKYFPVPRVEIKDVTLDLRFVISKVAEDPARVAARDLKLRTALLESSRLAASETFELVKQSLASSSSSVIKLDAPKLQELLTGLERHYSASLEKGTIQTTELNKRLQELLKDSTVTKPADLGPFQIIPSHQGFLIEAKDAAGTVVLRSTEPFQTRELALKSLEKFADSTRKKSIMFEAPRLARGKVFLKDTSSGATAPPLFEILVPLDNETSRRITDVSAWGGWASKAGMEDFLTKTQSLKDSTSQLALPAAAQLDEIQKKYLDAFTAHKNLVMKSSNPTKLDVLISKDELEKVPGEAVSSIKLSTDIRNYIWNIDDETNQAVLIPEP